MFSSRRVYGYPVLGRYGLGNMLFPWARCFLWCQDNEIPMIAPNWTHLRVGPYLRREKDKRNYQRLFLGSGYVTGMRKYFELTRGIRRLEADCEDVLCLHESTHRPQIVHFSGMADFFTSLISRSFEIRSELLRITKPRFLEPLKVLGSESFIGIHIRRGDFALPSVPALREGAYNVRIALEWYVAVLRKLRAVIGENTRALVFSDGSTEELRVILEIADVDLFRGGTAISDMLALSKAKVLIASGSTFSMWAGFLGQIPAVWYPGQRRQALLYHFNDYSLEPELDIEDDLPTKFVERLKSIRFSD